MKKITLLSFILISFAFTSVFAQKKLQVKETTFPFSTGKQNALVVEIFEVNEKDVDKELKALLKNYKAKVSVKKEVFGDDALIPDISSNTIDIYAVTADNKTGGVTLHIAFDLGGAYLSSSSHSKEYKVAEKIVYEFAVKVSKDAVQALLKEEEKNLKSLEKDLKSLEKSQKELEKDISDYKDKIKKAENDIDKSKKDQDEKAKAIKEQEKKVELIKEKEKAIK
jgi:hypothetical protein